MKNLTTPFSLRVYMFVCYLVYAYICLFVIVTCQENSDRLPKSRNKKKDIIAWSET